MDKEPEISDVILLESVCIRCGQYFERCCVEEHYVELSCDCRHFVVQIREFEMLEKLSTIQKCLVLNKFFTVSLVDEIIAFEKENDLNGNKVELIKKLIILKVAEEV